MLVRGASVVTRQAGGVRAAHCRFSGYDRVVPVGLLEEFTHVAKYIDEMLHIYLSPACLRPLAQHISRDFSAASVRYEAGFHDPLIEYIAAEVLARTAEFETSCGDPSGRNAGRHTRGAVAQSYSSHGAPDPFRVAQRSKGLEFAASSTRRSNISTQISTKEITVEELASVASLSRFHFSRMFKATMGQSPSRFIGQLRLELAKSLLMRRQIDRRCIPTIAGFPRSRILFDPFGGRQASHRANTATGSRK